jgi:hypothetical protein
VEFTGVELEDASLAEEA